MAIFHLEVKSIGRSQGRSAIAAAAYRSGSKLIDELTGEIHDYSKKQGVFHSEIIAPDDAPFWVKDRSTLWNSVQQQNTRKNSRWCKEINIALPRGVTDEAKLTLVREFVCDEIVNRFGVVCDISCHNFATNNPHVHLMYPYRIAEADHFGERVKAIDKRKTLCDLRAAWAKHANRYLSAGQREITEKSYKERGIDRLPEYHYGAKAWALHQRGIVTEIEIENRARREYNRQRQQEQKLPDREQER